MAMSFSEGIAATLVAEEQIEILKKKIKSDDKDVKSRIELGRILLTEEMPEEAAAEFEKALNIDSKNIKARILLAAALKKNPKPDIERIKGILEEASRIAPENGEVHLSLAQFYADTGKVDLALMEFDKAIEFSRDEPSLVSAHLGLTAVYKKMGDEAKAKAHYEKARKICPAIGDLIKNIEISQITPAPKYADQELKDGGGFYPSYEERVEKVRKEIKKRSEKK